MLPIARASSSPWNMPRISAMVCGMTSAAAAPWTARAVISIVGDAASAQSAEASTNAATPARKTRLRPAMSPSRPPVISSTANGRV